MLSLDRFDQNQWLNDAIINVYIYILARRYEFCFLNSHLLHFKSPDRKAEYGDVLESDLVLMPIHKCSHWYLLVMYKLSDTGYTIQEDRVVCFFDSLESPSRSYENIFTFWMQYLKNIGYRGEVYQRNVKIPQQSNNADCGVFHLAFADNIAQDRQKFFDVIENGTGLDWTIDAPKWRKLVKFEFTSANENSAVVPEKIIYVERSDDFDVAETARPTAHDSTMARTCPLPPPLRPSPSSWPADTELSVSLTPPPSQPTYQDAIGRLGQNVEMGNAGTDAGRDGNDEKMIDGSSLVACPLEAAFSSTHPSLAVSTPSQSSGHPPVSELTTGQIPETTDLPLPPAFIDTISSIFFTAFSVLPQYHINKLQNVDCQILAEEVQKALTLVSQQDGAVSLDNIRQAHLNGLQCPFPLWKRHSQNQSLKVPSDDIPPSLLPAPPFAAESLKTFQDLNNFAQGLGILGSILASAQLQEFLRM
ncbi:hypothetical protein MCOR14_011608, partial [Pyricularia oryzae]